MKKIISTVLSLSLLSVSALSMAACDTRPVLKVASWVDYIDMGGYDSYVKGSKSLDKEFEDWYYEQTGKKIRVDYIPMQDNENMYTKLDITKNTYDLLCPSEYMIMKMAAENLLEKYPESFFDTSIETNYYAKNVSPYIKNIFDNGKTTDGSSWSDYAAGYMWGTTGFTFNRAKVEPEEVKTWYAYDKGHIISAKENVRDSYFEGLGMYYEQELLALKGQREAGTITLEQYQTALSQKMNDTDAETMKAVEALLKSKMNDKTNKSFWGFETDEKAPVFSGQIDISYQWSGDAVYIMNEADGNDLRYDYCVPEAASNLWFDGWVMQKGANVEAATMFVNFLSKPENVIRNMYYINYTSCIANETIFEYIEETYAAQSEDTVEYDLSYFFGDGHKITADKEQLTRQLFAQYPDEETLKRCVIMNYFDSDANSRANKMWNNVLAG